MPFDSTCVFFFLFGCISVGDLVMWILNLLTTRKKPWNLVRQTSLDMKLNGRNQKGKGNKETYASKVTCSEIPVYLEDAASDRNIVFFLTPCKHSSVSSQSPTSTAQTLCCAHSFCSSRTAHLLCPSVRDLSPGYWQPIQESQLKGHLCRPEKFSLTPRLS